MPYDGYVDPGRFTTFDLAEVNVTKGYTSLLYGPNAMGGAINLISRKPVKLGGGFFVVQWIGVVPGVEVFPGGGGSKF